MSWLVGGSRTAHYFSDAHAPRSVCRSVERRPASRPATTDDRRCLTCIRFTGHAGPARDSDDVTIRAAVEALVILMRKWPYIPSERVLRQRATVLLFGLRDNPDARRLLLAALGERAAS